MIDTISSLKVLSIYFCRACQENQENTDLDQPPLPAQKRRF